MSSESIETGAIAPGYHGNGASLFWLMLRAALFNLLTLGIYRFWQRTKMRQHFWNGIRVAGSPLEYTGTGLEKLLGFLVAVVFLAFYLGLFQLGFFYVGLQLSNGSQVVGLFSSLPVVPLIFYAQYRARRYVLSRTQLRGIRFAMSQDAMAYVWRAMGHLLLTVVTLGVLYPRMHWYLEKFKTDRTSYGDLRMLQGGHWQSLMRPWLRVLASVFLPIIGFSVFMFAKSEIIAGLCLAGLLFAPFAWVNYGVASFRILTEGKSAGSVSFASQARTGTVLAIYLLGYLLIGVIGTIVGTVLVSMIGLITGQTLNLSSDLSMLSGMMQLVMMTVAVVGFLVIFLMWSALLAVFIAQPLLAHYVSTLTIFRAGELNFVRQRERVDFIEAEGFADALDVGGGF